MGSDETGKTRASALTVGAILANLPDIDFALGYLFHGDPRAMHAGITHTVMFAMLVAAVVAWTRVFGDALRTSAVAGVAVLSHVLMDLVSGKTLGFAANHRLMLLYPFSDERFGLPITLFLGIQHRDLPSLLSGHNAIAVLWELACFVPLLILSGRWKRSALGVRREGRRRGASGRPRRR